MGEVKIKKFHELMGKPWMDKEDVKDVRSLEDLKASYNRAKTVLDNLKGEFARRLAYLMKYYGEKNGDGVYYITFKDAIEIYTEPFDFDVIEIQFDKENKELFVTTDYDGETRFDILPIEAQMAIVDGVEKYTKTIERRRHIIQ